MTLDRIHVETIAHLASAIADGVDDRDHDDLAETVWTDFLDPLHVDGRPVIEPLGERRCRRMSLDDAALADRPFETTHGIDSGTMNPTSFKNGLVLDVAQAAMAAAPSELDVHRDRTVLVTVHTTDATFAPAAATEGWSRYDDGHSERRVLKVPESRRFADETVHELALSLAESRHALEHAERVEDLLILDGPLYPKRLLNWGNRDEERRKMAHREEVREAVRNYVELVENFVQRDVPIVGFVKNPTSAFVTRSLSTKGVETPWPDDTALFSRLLERTEDGQRRTDELTFTSWFVSRGGADEPMAADGETLGVERALDPELYEVTFMLLYEPRTDVLFKLEAPLAFTREKSMRKALTTQIVSEVASEEGPPVAVSKADELARIGRGEKASLREQFEERFDSETQQTYDDVRWPDEE